MWSRCINICGVFVVGYELPLSWNNLLTPREEIEKETNPLWFIEIKQYNLGVCKDFVEGVSWSKSFCLNKTSTIYIKSVSLVLTAYTSGKYLPFLFGNKGFIQKVELLLTFSGWCVADYWFILIPNFISWKHFHKEELEMEKEMTNHISIAKYAIIKNQQDDWEYKRPCKVSMH